MSNSGRTILGLDPGTAATGYGLVEQHGNRLRAVAYGVVETAAGLPLEQRLDIVFERVGALVREHRPEAAAVESLFFNVNVRTALAVGQARGVALVACAREGCRVYEYTPQQVKQAVVGYGAASKEQVKEMVRAILGMQAKPASEHAADALGIAVCHAHSAAMRESVERALCRQARDRREHSEAGA